MMTVPSSSPYFTQPTQIVKKDAQQNQRPAPTTQSTQPSKRVRTGSPSIQILEHTTQPTQIINGTPLKQPLSPFVPSSPHTTIEVPASSPFQPKSRPVASPGIERNNGTASRVASLMAPAGTSFKPPVGAGPSASKMKAKSYLNISDDELSEDYKRHESSADESPMRGDIKPSSFLTNDAVSPVVSQSKPVNCKAKDDISLKDIHDLRLRFLSRDVYKIVSKTKLSITLRACRDALITSIPWQVSRAVAILNGSKPKPRSNTNAQSSASQKEGGSQGTLSQFRLTTENSIQSETNSARAAQATTSVTSVSRDSSISPPSTKHNPPPPRRRLVQGRRNRSPTPPPVFSVSTSPSSAPTSPPPAHSQSPEEHKPETTSPQKAATETATDTTSKPRRRLQRGRRNRTPSPPEVPVSRKRKAETELEPETMETLSDSEGSQDASENVEDSVHQDHVLDYLNSCTVESLAQISGFSVADSKLMVASRPYTSISAAERVSKKETKSKSKANRVQIGSLFVEKLASWFAAFHAASEVIRQCENRGKKLQAAMANWPMDRNGRPQKEGCSLPLPVPEKPRLMAEDIELKSYQLLGLNWMDLLHSKGYSGILADDMGLGKTCQVISFIAHLVGSYTKRKPKPWPFLVVVPPSVCENWMAEFSRFAPKLRVSPYLGKDRRNMDPEEARKSHVILTSYSQVERQKEDLEWLQELNPYAAIFDEGHKLKNRKNLVYKQMSRVPTSWRLILSGTPVQNNLKELLTLLHFVEPDLFSQETFEQLDTIFEAKVPSKEIHNFAALAKERVSNARAIMAPFILQRRKEDVLDLAKKTEKNVIVDMHPKQKAVYEEVKNRYLVPKGKRASSTIKDSNPWMQLRKAAIHHQLFRVHFTDEIVKKIVDILWAKCSEEELYVQSKADRHKKLLLESYLEKSDFQLHLECKEFKKYIGQFDIPHRSWEEGPKVQKLLELVRGYMKNGDRVLVFSRFDLVIDILRETLAYAEIPYCELTGATGIAERFPEIERFNSDPSIPVFLLTTGAGGTGLNLTAANKIIIFDQSDNPQDDVQASNRAHRIGQTRDVEVIRLITKNTVEGLIFNSCVKKLMLARAVEGNIPVDDDDDASETVEQQCRRLMLLEEEGAAAMRASQNN
ncbi:SNF2 family N-terminal domain-containing protein [Xylariaceae sp. FL0594]|nr:SNF2 family N-terminal domain-containing protein [Xylariaceae sp. FL0594]